MIFTFARLLTSRVLHSHSRKTLERGNLQFGNDVIQAEINCMEKELEIKERNITGWSWFHSKHGQHLGMKRRESLSSK